MEDTDASFEPQLHATLEVSSSVSCLAVAPDGSLAVGSEDGSVKVFQLPSSKASKAIMGLGVEVSSAVFAQASRNSSTSSGLWVAFGSQIALFDLSLSTLVLKLSEATRTFQVLPSLHDEDDVLNEISLGSGHVAFTLDSGVVGVIDLDNGQRKEMKSKHTSIAGNVSFVPDRASELRSVVSGGYDSSLLHFDYRQGNILSRYSLESLQSPDSGSTNISLSPPFITSLSISPYGVIAGGAANGRLWVGFGGDRSPAAQASNRKVKKKRRYWEGLKDSDDSAWLDVAQGPVVGVQFADSEHIITCSLGGKLVCISIERGDAGQSNSHELKEVWSTETKSVVKVNSMRVTKTSESGVNEYWVIVGGLSRGGKGCAEVYRLVMSA